MKGRLIILLHLFVLFGLNAQSTKDSLLLIWEDERNEQGVRAQAYTNYIINEYLFNAPDSSYIMVNELLQFIKITRYPEYKVDQAKAYNLQGISFYLRSQFDASIEYYLKSLVIQKEIGNEEGTAKCLNNIGYTHYMQGDDLRALDYYQRSLAISESVDDIGIHAVTLGNIGLVYADQEDYELALSYFFRSLKISRENGNEHEIANWLDNIGLIYARQENYDLAIVYHERSLEIAQKIGDKVLIASAMNNMGVVFYKRAKYDKALELYKESKAIREEINDKNGIATTLLNIGELYQSMGMYSRSTSNCLRSLKISQEVGSLLQQTKNCYCLYRSFKALGRPSEALKYHEEILLLEDSLKIDETSKELLKMEFQRQVMIDSIASAEEFRLAEEAHQEEVRQQDKIRNILVWLGLLALIIALAFYRRSVYIRKSKAKIEKEKEKSDNLLLNILPADIAQELKENGKAEAKDFELISILFTDFIGFTEASEMLSAQELVEEIHNCFKAFDAIVEKYGVEKIKTIGDAYMAAGGLPSPNSSAIKNTVLAALEMQAFIGEHYREMEHQNRPAFQMRVGIHSGPIVAGIVGVKKFTYDLWGDTVNTASRMESNGEVGRVNISAETYEHIKGDADFSFEKRAEMEVKGKGLMTMYFVDKA